MAILAAVLVPTVTNKIKDANESSAKSSVSALAESIRADIITANTNTNLTFQGEYCTVTITPASDSTAAKVVASAIATEYGSGKDIEISNDGTNGVIKIKHKNYNWYYTVDSTGKVTMGLTAVGG